MINLASGHPDEAQGSQSTEDSPSGPTADAAEADDESDGDEQEEGAVIDFNALRRGETDESLEDEMAKLLNDLTSDANKAS